MGYTDHLDMANAYVDDEMLVVNEFKHDRDLTGQSTSFVSGQPRIVDNSKLRQVVRYRPADIVESLAICQALVDQQLPAPRYQEWVAIKAKAQALGLLP